MPVPSVITIGNFDGVHLGHLWLLQQARTLANRLGAEVLAMPFDPSPLTMLRPGSEPKRLCDRHEKIAWLQQAGATVAILEPTPELLALSAEAFIDHLRSHHGLVGVVEGRDFRFGRGRAGDMTLFAELGQRHHFEVLALPPQTATLGGGEPVILSSSHIRKLLAEGRVEAAAAALGRPYTLAATVVRGEQRGRQIGVPTANLDMAALQTRQLPGPGVYLAEAVLAGGPIVPAAVSVGHKPTFDGQALLIEAHLLGDQNAIPTDFYGQTLRLHFYRWIRGQRTFDGLAALKNQIQHDLTQVRCFYASMKANPESGLPGHDATIPTNRAADPPGPESVRFVPAADG